MLRTAPRPRALAAAVLSAAALLPALLAPGAAAAETTAPAPSDPAVQATLDELAEAPTAAEQDARDEARTENAQAAAADDFYATPTHIPDTPGTLIRQEPSAFYLDPVKLVRLPATATRVMYSSQDAQGAPIAVTGTVLTPTAAWTGTGERPVIGYAVGTQGLGDLCAPSRTLATGEQYEGIGISGLLSRGYTVVVTDYEGLGSPGTHTYMVRESQAHTVLDSVRAAQDVAGADVTPTSPVALAGYSQGGGATAAAAELADEYAPELNLKGAYAGAPPADLLRVAGALERKPYAGFLLYAMAGQLAAYDVDPGDYLNTVGEATLARAEVGCTTDAIGFAWLDSSTLTTSGQTFPQLVRSDATLAGIIADQRLGEPGRAPEVPVMIAHSITDDVIPYSVGRGLGLRWCAQGARVRFDPVFTPTHVGGYLAAQPRAQSFLDAVLRDRWTPNSCGWF